MAVTRAWTDPTASKANGGLALITGDTLDQTTWQNAMGDILLLGAANFGPVKLQYVSATSIKAKVVNGGVIKIAGTLYNLTGDVTANNTSIFVDGVSGSNLGASTLYYVYLFNNSGTITIDFSTTTHATDTTAGNVGTEIKNGVSSRTLIGMIRTNGSNQFVDSVTQRFTLSYFNRRNLAMSNQFTADRTTTSISIVEINAEIQLQFLTWSDESCIVSYLSNVNIAAGDSIFASIAFDGTTIEKGTIFNASPAGVDYYHSQHVHKTGLSEGYHYATIVGCTGGAGTAKWYGNNNVSLGTQTNTTLYATIRG